MGFGQKVMDQPTAKNDCYGIKFQRNGHSSCFNINSYYVIGNFDLTWCFCTNCWKYHHCINWFYPLTESRQSPFWGVWQILGARATFEFWWLIKRKFHKFCFAFEKSKFIKKNEQCRNPKGPNARGMRKFSWSGEHHKTWNVGPPRRERPYRAEGTWDSDSQSSMRLFKSKFQYSFNALIF